MRIDNDFLTLMGLLCRRSILTGKMVKATEPKTIRAFHKMLDEQGAKIDALVAKINAADDAAARDMEILLFKSIDPANDPDYEELIGLSSDSPIAWVLKKPVEGKPYRIDNPFNPFNSRACKAKDAAPAPRVVNYPFRQQPKDTAPASPFKSFSLSDEETRDFLLNLADADYFEDHLAPARSAAEASNSASPALNAMAAPSKPKGCVSRGDTYEEAIRGLIVTMAFYNVACPISIERVVDPLAGNGAGGDYYVARWTVDGEGR